jgi:hypothetical protein
MGSSKKNTWPRRPVNSFLEYENKLPSSSGFNEGVPFNEPILIECDTYSGQSVVELPTLWKLWKRSKTQMKEFAVTW